MVFQSGSRHSLTTRTFRLLKEADWLWNAWEIKGAFGIGGEIRELKTAILLP